MARWHVMTSGDRPEELSFEEVEAAYRAGRIDEHTLVWTKGMERWVPLAHAISLRRNSSFPPPPPPVAVAAAAFEVAPPRGPEGAASSPLHADSVPLGVSGTPRAFDELRDRWHPRRFLRAGSSSLAWTSYAWITWYVAGLLGATAGVGFFGYAMWLYVLSAIACCFCPCLGLAGASATTALWGLLWMISVCIVTAAWCVAMGFSTVAALKLMGDEVSPRPVVLGNFVMHVALGLVLLATGSFALLASTLGVSR
jgi:hypothetical protein